jgi:hypothetical protein
MPALEEKQQSLIAKCVELGRNDPSATSLDLARYGKLEWSDACDIAGALANNILLEELSLSLKTRHLCVDGSIPLTHFLSSSPSLRSLKLAGDTITTYSHSLSSILESISRNKLLVKLELHSLVYERPSLIEDVLAKTQTLSLLEVTNRCAQTWEV